MTPQEKQITTGILSDIIHLINGKLEEAKRWEERNRNDGYPEPAKEWGLLAAKYELWINHLKSMNP